MFLVLALYFNVKTLTFIYIKVNLERKCRLSDLGVTLVTSSDGWRILQVVNV